jgi:hypothetical protein
MHSSQHHGFQFHYNGDYSGLIYVTDIFDHETQFTFGQIRTMALMDHFRNPAFSGAYRDFVAQAAVNEAISRLEQMATEEALANPWLRNILMEITSKGIND